MPACARCGNQSPDGFRFCGSCGAPLAEAAPARETRKVVTVLFCDVTGSTALGERLDPEALRRTMARYFDVARAVVESHGGTVEKFIGDAVMAVFGVPVVHEDDALRAVRAAAELRERLAALDEELERELGVRLTVRTGVNTGEVVTGTAERLATGDAVVVAQRLESEAAPGEVLLGEATLRLVRDAVEAEPAGPLELKGKSASVAAHRLLSVRSGAPGVGRRLDAPLVGRERELRRLLDAFESAEQRRSCELFTLLGAAGVGKSRLVAELVRALEGRARVLSGRCLPYGEGITYWALAEVLRDATALGEADTAEMARTRIARLVGGEDAERVAVELAPALGLSGGASGEVAWAARRLLGSLARDQPLVVVLDDVHWGEPAFLDLVEHVADWTRDAPLLLLCLARPELLDERPAWGGGKLNATSVLLEPLSEDETGTLLTNLLGGGEPAEALRRRVAEAAEGNPLFVEELLAMLLEDGVVARENGAWVARGNLDAVQVPPTIAALLAARLDRLELPEREVLERAAVEGKVFHRGAVTELSPTDARDGVPERIMDLVRKELVRPDRSAFAGDEAFRFRHLLIRDAAYDALPKSTRATLHEAYAAWLERRAADRLGEYEEILAYHLERAYRHRAEIGPVDDHARALATRSGEVLASAGLRAASRSDAASTVSLLTRAAALLPVGHAGRPPALVDLARALNERGEFVAAAEVLDEAIDAARSLGQEAVAARAELVRVAGVLSTDTDRGMSSLAPLLDRAVPVLEAAGNHVGLAEAAMLRMLELWLAARAADAAAVALHGADHARRGGDLRGEGELRGWSLLALKFDPTPVPQAIRLAREGVERAVTADMEAHALNALSVLEAMEGEIDGARERAWRSVALLRERGHDVLAETTEGSTICVIEMLAGDPEAAERSLRGAHDRLERLGETGYRTTMAAMLAEVLAAMGRFDEALRFADTAERSAGATDLVGQWGWRHARAQALLGLGRPEEALRLAADALRLADRSDHPCEQAAIRRTLARARALSGDVAEARVLLGAAIELYRRKGVPVEAERTSTLLAVL